MLLAKALFYICAFPEIGFVPPATPGVSSMLHMWKAAEECRTKNPSTPCLKHYFVRQMPGKPDFFEAAYECAPAEQIPL